MATSAEISESFSALRAMASSIQPNKVVPPTDIGRKREREGDKLDEAFVQTHKDMASLVNILSQVLASMRQPKSASEPCQTVIADVKSFMDDVAIALNNVPKDEQLACVIEMLKIAKSYIPQSNQ